MLILFQFLSAFFFSFYLIFRIFAIFLWKCVQPAIFHVTIIYIRKGMNKSELISAMAANANMTKADTAKALNAFLEEVANALKRGEKVTLVGFGTFSVIERASRMGINPATKQSIEIPSKKAVKFKAGTELSIE